MKEVILKVTVPVAEHDVTAHEQITQNVRREVQALLRRTPNDDSNVRVEPLLDADEIAAEIELRTMIRDSHALLNVERDRMFNLLNRVTRSTGVRSLAKS